MILQTLFEQFLQEKRYVQNVSNNTVEFYRQSFNAFAVALPPLDVTQDGTSPLLTLKRLNSAIVAMRESGKSAACVNAYLRGMRPFVNWLVENEHLAERLKLKKLKCEEKAIRTFSDAQIRAILSYKPKSKTENRLIALLTLLTDTGVRINEALTLTRGSVDFENLLIDVKGKGSKVRRIPFSLECRKVLFKHLRSHSHELVFPNHYGGKLRYDNLRRDFRKLISKLGIKGFDGSFHAFRRYYATFAIRHNTNPFVVQRQLGHKSQTMVGLYTKLSTEDLQQAHVSALQAGGAR